MIEIGPAESGAALAEVIRLAEEYVAWMLGEVQARYPELDVEEFASEHTYDDLHKKFPGDHVSPDGCLLLARQEGLTCGCIALGRLTDGICEMRTLFVRPEFRGSGAGRKLAEACLAQARLLGYRAIRLDTLAFMEGAQSLYQSMGFHPIEPYLDLSPELRQKIRFFEREL